MESLLVLPFFSFHFIALLSKYYKRKSLEKEEMD